VSAAAPSPRELDAAARLATQTVFDRPLALEAGAGTGKTAALVARIVAWCVGPGWELEAGEKDDPTEIAGRVLDGVVAITFTEDAAAEMAERVARALFVLQQWDGATEPSGEFPGLEEVAAGRDEDGTRLRGLFRQALPEDVTTVSTRAGALLVQMERLRASTIHAFASSILTRFPVEAGLHPAFTVDADASLVQEMVETAAEDVLLRAYALDGGDALALAEKGIGPKDITDAALELSTAGVPPEVLEEDPFTEERVAGLLRSLEDVLDGCLGDLQVLTTVSGRSTAVLRTASFLLQMLEELKGWEENPFGALDTVRKSLATGFRGIEGKLKDWSKGDFGKNPPDGLDVERMTDGGRRLKALLGHLDVMDPTTFNQLRRVLRNILAQAEAEKRRRGVVVFQDLLVRARALLEAHEGVRRTLQSEIRQLLVDEMQDTDPDQAGIVRLLALEGPPEERPCLFLVGDPKQSIYGWRSADLAVYDELVKTIENAGGERHSLVVNFRSVPAILDEVKRIVEPVMDEEEGLQPRFVELQACRRLMAEEGHVDALRGPVEHWAVAEPGEGGAVPSDKTPADRAARIEAEAVALDIASLLEQGERLSRMAVLMRGRGKLQVLLEELRKRRIPYEVGKDRSYFRTREVLEAMALVRLVLDRHDPLALTTVLRSPQVGVPDAALAPLWRAGLPGLVARIPADHGTVPPEASGVVTGAAEAVEALGLDHVKGLDEVSGWPEALLAFLETLAKLRESWRSDPPDRFLEELRQKTLLEPLAAGRFPGAYRLANVDRFLRSLEERLLEGATAGTLLRWLRRLGREQPDEPTGRPREDAGEAVRVLTIHGAKGLEFDHVWLVQTHVPGGTGSNKKTDSGLVDGRWEFELVKLRTPGYHHLEERRKRVEEAERVRLLYVALTRAKNRLVTSGCWNPKGSTGPFLEHMKNRDGKAPVAKGTWPTLDELWAGAGENARLERHGALWGLPGLPAWSKAIGKPSSDPSSATLPPLDHIARDETRLRELRLKAHAHQARPWLRKMSDEAHRKLAEDVAATVEGAETPEEEAARRRHGVKRDVATAVGTAVHRILERFDLEGADPGAELKLRQKEAEAWLQTALPPGELPQAQKRLNELVATSRSGKLWQSWLDLRGHVVARELPVLLPAPDPPETPDDPAGALTGAIDLLYRDPDTGELVVADFKTDEPEHLEDRAEAYQLQLVPYARAIAEALGLPEPPRTELWFLAAGKVVRGA